MNVQWLTSALDGIPDGLIIIDVTGTVPIAIAPPLSCSQTGCKP